MSNPNPTCSGHWCEECTCWCYRPQTLVFSPVLFEEGIVNEEQAVPTERITDEGMPRDDELAEPIYVAPRHRDAPKRAGVQQREVQRWTWTPMYGRK
jgi:hypothetical protein